MKKKKPRGANRVLFQGGTRRYKMYYVTNYPPVERALQSGKGNEITDKGLRGPITAPSLSVRKIGRKYVGVTSRRGETRVPGLDQLQHEYDHMRELAFLDRFGFRRNSSSMLAVLAEAMLQEHYLPRRGRVPFDTIRETARKFTIPRDARRPTPVLDEIVMGLFSYFPGPARARVLVKLFRSAKMRPHLDVLNNTRDSVSIRSRGDEEKAKKSLLTLIDFCETEYKRNKSV